MNALKNIGKWEYALTINGNANLCDHYGNYYEASV